MDKIVKLPDTISNMIAAGEVVERPAGIIKELIENSIDANSSYIHITIEEGGISYIKVEDNGSGMSKNDAQTAFERHATSKIHSQKQLFAISTLGFRGEALPSIAAVSHVTLTTCINSVATQVIMEYGIMQSVKPISRNQGTSVEVRKLFQNTPARLKHLSNPYYEASKVGEVIKKFACSYPNIAFHLTSDKKDVFKSSGNGSIEQVLAQVYDYHILKDLIKFERSFTEFSLQLIMAQPQHTKTRNSILIYINQRMIKSYKIQKAIIEGYQSYIPVDRMPIVVLNIQMDYELVDVNVHPSKQEVRISKENILLQKITTTIQELLTEQYSVPQIKPKEKTAYETMNFDLHYEVKEKPTTILEEIKIAEKIPVASEVRQDIVEVPKAIIKSQNIFHQMRVLSQLQGKYILCEHEDGLYIIDQHAAAERINYEKIQAKLSQHQINQVTLTPIMIPINFSIQSRIDEIVRKMNAIHIPVELFSNDTLIIREIPDWIVKEHTKQFVIDVVDKMMEDEKISLVDLRKHAIATAACHSSIRFNRRLNLVEMQYLLQDLANCEHPFHCPHGRTVAILMDNYQLEKQFMRVK